jgi:Flp pilus assembly protein TadD
MQKHLIVLALIALAACDSGPKPVDLANLPPLSPREQALIISAEGAMAQGNLPQAEKNYLDAVAASEGHVEAHLALADLYIKNSQPKKARDVLKRAAEFQPNHVAVSYQLGKLYLQEGDTNAALSAFKRGIETQPNSLDLLSGAGIASDMLREHHHAQRYYEQAITSNPTADLSLVRTNLGMSYLLDNKPAQAAELLSKDADMEHASPVTRHNLALAYGMLGRHAEAKALVAGEMTEDQRQASLKRLAQYIAGRDDSGRAIAAPVSPVMVKDAN